MLARVAEGVLVHQSALLQNNAAVVEGRHGVLLIDPGIRDVEMACLARDLGELDQTVAAGFATHPDWDHVLWHTDLGDAPRYGTARCAALMEEVRSAPDWKAQVRAGLPPEVTDEVPLDPFGLITALPDRATEVPWGGPPARLLEHRGHSQGHAAVLIESRRVLVAGDMLSDLFVPMLDLDAAEPIEDYLAALRLFEAVADDVDVLVPGHGSVCRGDQVRARIELDVAYVNALRDGRTPDDPRVGPTTAPGWEWISDVHEGQVSRLARRLAGQD